MDVAREKVEHEAELQLFVHEGFPVVTEHKGWRASYRKDQPGNNLPKYLAQLEPLEAVLSPA